MKNQTSVEEIQKAWQTIDAKVHSDENYRKKLLENPTQVVCEAMRQHHIELPKDMRFKAFADKNNPKAIRLEMIAPQGKAELNDEHLQSVVGGGLWGDIAKGAIGGLCGPAAALTVVGHHAWSEKKKR